MKNIDSGCYDSGCIEEENWGGGMMYNAEDVDFFTGFGEGVNNEEDWGLF